jgi:paraquat-inducible protein B
MVFYTWSQQGPVIEIAFESASGLESGKTKIKARDIDIGVVTEVHFNANYDGVIVIAQMSPDAEPFLVKDSQFWVVEPRIDATGISGLNTLLSGSYIELAPGKSNIKAKNFSSLAKPPVTPPSAPGLHITLNSGGRFDFAAGDSILYKGLEVGQIEDVYFNFDERIVYYNAFINAPYHDLLTTTTKFWSVSGVTVDIGADGLEIKAGTLSTILSGGITFDIPKSEAMGNKITSRTEFTIYPNREAIFKQSDQHQIAIDYILMLKESIAGLERKAPVKFRGITVGSVAEVNVPYETEKNILNKDTSIPVKISLYPNAMGLNDTEEGGLKANKDIEKWISNGMSVTLETDNILTGDKYIEIEYVENSEEIELTRFQSLPIIPVVPSSFGAIVNNANKLLEQATRTLKRFDTLAASVDTFVVDTTETQLPLSIKNTLNEIDTLAGDLTQGSPLQQELMRTFNTLNRVLYELEPLLEQVSEQPNSMIFDLKLKADEQPRAAK